MIIIIADNNYALTCALLKGGPQLAAEHLLGGPRGDAARGPLRGAGRLGALSLSLLFRYHYYYYYCYCCYYYYYY